MSVTVHIKYKDIEETFNGDVDAVWADINRFFSQVIPIFDVARSVVLTIDLKEVIEASKGLVAVADEGPLVLVPKRKLTDSESLLLKLLAAYVGSRLGALDRVWLSRKELQEWLGKSGKIISTRLGELCREGLVVKTKEGGYQLSTFGIKRLVADGLARIKSKV